MKSTPCNHTIVEKTGIDLWENLGFPQAFKKSVLLHQFDASDFMGGCLATYIVGGRTNVK